MVYQCLAELIDNSLDELSRASVEDPSIERRVDAILPKHTEVSRESVVSVSDNGRGMSIEQLGESIRAGSTGNDMYGSLGLFGMGFNIATARLGQVTTVKTGRVGDDHWSIATINLKDMRARRTFSIPLTHEPKGLNDHGTSISVSQLNKDTLDSLRKQSAIPNSIKALGKVYTYMLRDPENSSFSGREIVGGLGLSLHVNGRAVQPLIPCIWDPSRSVSYKGQEIMATQKVDKKLQDAKACMECGNWEPEYSDTCTQCDSENLVLRPRRIWGWLGIQRYDHRSDFGVSFFRQGRCIVHNDQELFDFVNEIGDRELEYPAELGRGRIVGEVHIDHVPVNIRKTDFDRSQRSWQYMREVVRGEGPLTDKRSKQLNYEKNMSPLGKLFHAYRRYDPGLRYLVPGNGDRALAETAREWGEHFRRGLPEYQSDEKWYAAAAQHDQIVAGQTAAVQDESATEHWLQEQGLGDLVDAAQQKSTGTDSAGNTPQNGNAQNVDSEDVFKPESINEKTARYLTHSVPISGMDKKISLGTGETHLTAYVTTGTTVSLNGTSSGFDLIMKSGKISVFVRKDHALVDQYGWSHAQIALIALSQYLPDKNRSADTPHEVLMRLIHQFPDLALTPSAVRARAGDLLEDIRAAATRVTTKEPHKYWRALHPQAKQAVQYAAAQSDPDVAIEALIDTGEFGAHVVPEALLSLLDAHPEALLDGAMFKANFAAITDERTRSLILGRLRALLLDLDRALDLPVAMPGRELLRLGQSIEILSDSLAVVSE